MRLKVQFERVPDNWMKTGIADSARKALGRKRYVDLSVKGHLFGNVPSLGVVVSETPLTAEVAPSGSLELWGWVIGKFHDDLLVDRP